MDLEAVVLVGGEKVHHRFEEEDQGELAEEQEGEWIIEGVWEEVLHQWH